MKYIFAQSASTKFQWELDVVITNIRSFDRKTPIVLLFLKENPAVVQYFEDRYDYLEIHSFEDDRTKRGYAPSIRPYLIWRYLLDNPEEEKENFFQLDSDVIFREIPDFSKMPLRGKALWASDCGGYIDYDYLITRDKGQEIVDKFSEILSIEEELIKKTPGGGAQWYYSGTSAEMWWHIWQDSDLLYEYLEPLNSNVQKWTAEMWSQLYNFAKFGYAVKLSPELKFCMSTDSMEIWESSKILHNAGVTGENSSYLFFKGSYLHGTPFSDDFSWVRRDKASSEYVRAIENVLL